MIGDYGMVGQPGRDVANLIQNWNPDFIITTGDNNYPNGEASTIDSNIGQYYHDFIFQYAGRYGSGADTHRFFPSLGYHDYYCDNCPQPYLDYFTLLGNERYYDFTWGSAHFFIINSNIQEPDGTDSSSVQAQWLKEQLSSSPKNFKFVFMHHPPYSSGPYGSASRMQWPYKEWGADAVFAGHDHIYERIVLDDFLYFVSGLGGKSIHSFYDLVEGGEYAYNGDYGAIFVNVSRQKAIVQFVTRSGEVIDTYDYGKQTKWYEDGKLKAVWRYRNGRQHGKQTKWYPNGRKQAEWNYKDDQFDGTQTQWYENGKLRLEHNFKEGQPHGVWTEWFENGTKRGEWYFKDGKEIK